MDLHNRIAKSRAPLRLGLAGGGSDIASYFNKFGGNVLSITINKYAYCQINYSPSERLQFSALDLDVHENFDCNDGLELSSGLSLHKACYEYISEHYLKGVRYPIEVKTLCEAPVGSGLGSSSCVVVAMLKAYQEFFNLFSMDDYEMARAAVVIEREICGFAGGVQDQYSAVFGGVNFIEIDTEGRVVVNQLRLKKSTLNELSSSLVIYFTGVSRESAAIIKDQMESVFSCEVDDSSSKLNAMHEIKAEAIKIKNALLLGDFGAFNRSLINGWESKKKSSKSVSNEQLDSIYQTAMDEGASSGKVSGAGGGGFMMFIVPFENKKSVEDSLKNFGGAVNSAEFVETGVESWLI